jgi:parallel beta-helix repeat protein
VKRGFAINFSLILFYAFGFLLANGAILQVSRYSNPIHVNALLVVNCKGEQSNEAFFSIQQAINAAENGSTVYVSSGVYYERIIVNKTVSLVGENASATIIDGQNVTTVVEIVADNVSISGFTIRYSGWGWTKSGVYVHYADNCEIKNNIFFTNCHNIRLNFSRWSRVTGNVIDGNGYGIRLLNSENCLAADNNVSNCIGGVHLEYATNCTVRRNFLVKNDQGVRFYSPCTYNRVFENIVCNNTYDGMITDMPGNSTLLYNSFFHNSFINNTYPFIYRLSGNFWDNGYPLGGNYWDRYNGTDIFSGENQNVTGYDGVGDVPYALGLTDKDRYPLMHPYGSIMNQDTNLTYLTIREAINAQETLNGHTILATKGIYYEHLVLNKSVKLLGENQTTTVLDGGGLGTVLQIVSDNVTVTGFTIQKSGSGYPPYGNDCGMLLDHCRGANVSHNIMSDNRIGLYLFFSDGNALENNLVCSNREDGVWLWYSGSNVLKNNRIWNNSYNFGVFGSDFSDYDNAIDSSNIVDDKPICYLTNVENQVFDDSTNASALYLVNCANVTVKGLNFSRNGHGVFCYNVTHSRVENVTATCNNYGVYLLDSTNNTVVGNRCFDNWVGVCLEKSVQNIVENNVVEKGEKGISLYEADNNTLEANTVYEAEFGVRLFSSSYNRIFHNNLIENLEQASLISSFQNVWDDGFEGNFWSNYTGSDFNADGLGDEVQYVDIANVDHYPLMGFFTRCNVCLLTNSTDFDVISNSSLLGFEYEAANCTIRLMVNGTDGTFGFCRVRVPHSLVKPEIAVILDDGLVQVLNANYSLRDDVYSRWIYFAYQHSTHEATIVEESWLILFFSSLLASSLLLLLKKSRRSRHCQFRHVKHDL